MQIIYNTTSRSKSFEELSDGEAFMVDLSAVDSPADVFIKDGDDAICLNSGQCEPWPVPSEHVLIPVTIRPVILPATEHSEIECVRYNDIRSGEAFIYNSSVYLKGIRTDEDGTLDYVYDLIRSHFESGINLIDDLMVMRLPNIGMSVSRK